jgi:hypothetical protein
MNRKPGRPMPATSFRDRDRAEAVAVAALTFLAAEPERLGRFLAISGIAPATVRQLARSPAFLGGVLDYLATDERLLLSVATELEIAPDKIMQAREILSPSAGES